MLLDEIATYLEAQGLATVGTNLFKGILPDKPDFAIAIHEYSGMDPIRTMNSAAGQMIAERPRFQIIVRSDRANLVAGSYTTARNKADAIWKALDGLSSTLSGVQHLYIEALQSPHFLERDENERVKIACNYQTMKRIS